MEVLSIYYDDNTNIFEDEFGVTEDSLVGIISNKDMVKYKAVGGTYYRENNGITYEVVFPIKGINRTLYYDEEANVMYDEYGITVFNIFSIISPNDLYLFKKEKKTRVVVGVAGGEVEIQWPDCKP